MDRMKHSFATQGVCARQIDIDIDDDGVISDVVFIGGCKGNTKGVAALAIGRKASDLVSILEDIECGDKGTSCPAQLAHAIKQAIGG